jgi:hypothetical protein
MKTAIPVREGVLQIAFEFSFVCPFLSRDGFRLRLLNELKQVVPLTSRLVLFHLNETQKCSKSRHLQLPVRAFAISEIQGTRTGARPDVWKQVTTVIPIEKPPNVAATYLHGFAMKRQADRAITQKLVLRVGMSRKTPRKCRTQSSRVPSTVADIGAPNPSADS